MKFSLLILKAFQGIFIFKSSLLSHFQPEHENKLQQFLMFIFKLGLRLKNMLDVVDGPF